VLAIARHAAGPAKHLLFDADQLGDPPTWDW
jgi:hypothetical protein